MNHKELAPPVFMRHMQHQKDPLPAIGQHQSPIAHGGSRGGDAAGVLSPPHVVVGGGSSTEHSPHKALEESPTAVVGSLAVARRRARNNNSLAASPEHHRSSCGQLSTEGGDMSPRSPSPPEAETPTAEPSHSNSLSASALQSRQEASLGGDEHASVGHHHQPSKKTLNVLLDVLDPDTDGSTIVDMLPKTMSSSTGPPPQHQPPDQQQQQAPPTTSGPTHFQRSFQ